MVLAAVEDITSIESLCRSIRARLGKGRGGPAVLRTWSKTDLITVEEFLAALPQTI